MSPQTDDIAHTDRGHEQGPRIAERMRTAEEFVHVDQPVHEARVRMREKGLAFLAVVDGDEVVGVLTARDVGAEQRPVAGDGGTVKVRDHMMTDFGFCYADDDLATASAVMWQEGHPGLLVFDRDGHLMGSVTLAEVGPRPQDPPAPGSLEQAQRRHVTTQGRAKEERFGRIVSYDVRPKLKR